MIDFHSHILPGVDDGSQSLKESIEMLRLQAQQGITHVVCTPHFYPSYDHPEEFLRRRNRAEEALRAEMAKHTDLPQLLIGAEVRFFRGISHSESLKRLTIQNKSCIMIEMASSPWKQHIYDELKEIYRCWGVVPIIAHVDRYIFDRQNRDVPDRLQELPVLVQANAEFFLHRKTQKTALRMLRENKIQLLGSDCHNLTDRPPNMGQAMECIAAKLGREALDQIHSAGRNILGLLK